MIRQIASLKMQHRRWLPLLLSTFLVLAASSSAHADLIVAAQTVAANAGSSGNTLELTLQNTGPSAVTIGGFSFGVSTSGTDINFTLADINTALAPYIFKGNSLFGPNINTSTGHSLTASDLDSDPAGATVSAASTVGLGRLFFDVSPAATQYCPDCWCLGQPRKAKPCRRCPRWTPSRGSGFHLRENVLRRCLKVLEQRRA